MNMFITMFSLIVLLEMTALVHHRFRLILHTHTHTKLPQHLLLSEVYGETRDFLLEHWKTNTTHITVGRRAVLSMEESVGENTPPTGICTRVITESLVILYKCDVQGPYCVNLTVSTNCTHSFCSEQHSTMHELCDCNQVVTGGKRLNTMSAPVQSCCPWKAINNYSM